MARRRKIESVVQPLLPAAETPAPAAKASPYVRQTMYFKRPVHALLRQLAYELNRSQHDILQEAFAQWVERNTGRSLGDYWPSDS